VRGRLASLFGRARFGVVGTTLSLFQHQGANDTKKQARNQRAARSLMGYMPDIRESGTRRSAGTSEKVNFGQE
jgi:hypothetical protein